MKVFSHYLLISYFPCAFTANIWTSDCLRENLLFGCFIRENMLSTGYEMTGYLEVSMGRAPPPPETSVMTSQNGSSRPLTCLFDGQNLDKDRREYFFLLLYQLGTK